MTDTCTRSLWAAVLAMLLSAGHAGPAVAQEEEAGGQGLVDSWHTTVAQKSLVISVRPGGQALVMFIQRGQHSIDHLPWKPLGSGILIEGVPRIRLWPGRHDQELFAEIEPVPQMGYDPEKEFRRSFRMALVSEHKPPQGWRERPVPAHWTIESYEQAFAQGEQDRRAADIDEAAAASTPAAGDADADVDAVADVGPEGVPRPASTEELRARLRELNELQARRLSDAQLLHAIEQARMHLDGLEAEANDALMNAAIQLWRLKQKHRDSRAAAKAVNGLKAMGFELLPDGDLRNVETNERIPTKGF